MNTPMVVAFDLSLCATGYARGDGVGVLTPPSAVARGVARLRWIRDAVLEHCAGADLVVVEGYAYARMNQAYQLGELGGVIRVALVEAGFPWVEVAPSSRALFAAGKGNAAKELVLAEAIRKLDYQGSSTDEADALWLRQMALEWYQEPGAAYLPEKKRKALLAVNWPILRTLTQGAA